jgi:hypothetical protein
VTETTAMVLTILILVAGAVVLRLFGNDGDAVIASALIGAACGIAGTWQRNKLIGSTEKEKTP